MNRADELQAWQDALETQLAVDGLRELDIRIYQQTQSAQDIAKTFAPNKALIIADQQTAGRGRLGRQWVSQPGASVLMSLCWPTAGMSITHDRVSMLAGLAVAKAVEALLPGVAIRLKWPNDVMIASSKLAGILIEAVPGAVVIGIGLNVTRNAIKTAELTQRATCMEAHGHQIDRLDAIVQIVKQLQRMLCNNEPSKMLDEWRAHASLGQTQTFEQAGQRLTGEVIGLDPDHGLIVRRDTGEIVTLPAATTSVVK